MEAYPPSLRVRSPPRRRRDKHVSRDKHPSLVRRAEQRVRSVVRSKRRAFKECAASVAALVASSALDDALRADDPAFPRAGTRAPLLPPRGAALVATHAATHARDGDARAGDDSSDSDLSDAWIEVPPPLARPRSLWARAWRAVWRAPWRAL